jgi:hypothetical protein
MEEDGAEEIEVELEVEEQGQERVEGVSTGRCTSAAIADCVVQYRPGKCAVFLVKGARSWQGAFAAPHFWRTEGAVVRRFMQNFIRMYTS